MSHCVYACVWIVFGNYFSLKRVFYLGNRINKKLFDFVNFNTFGNSLFSAEKGKKVIILLEAIKLHMRFVWNY